jgi:hypothetical protein
MNFRLNRGQISHAFPFLCVSWFLHCRRELINLDRTSDANHNCGRPAITSAELLCTLSPPLFRPSGTPPVLSPSPSVSSWSVYAKLTSQKRVTLCARRQQRYSRDESALAAALRRTTDYERIFPPKPSIQYATNSWNYAFVKRRLVSPSYASFSGMTLLIQIEKHIKRPSARSVDA